MDLETHKLGSVCWEVAVVVFAGCRGEAWDSGWTRALTPVNAEPKPEQKLQPMSAPGKAIPVGGRAVGHAQPQGLVPGAQQEQKCGSGGDGSQPPCRCLLVGMHIKLSD